MEYTCEENFLLYFLFPSWAREVTAISSALAANGASSHGGRAHPTVSWSDTVSASVLGSFSFGHGAFTPPVRSLLTPAAAHKRLAAAPSGETSPRRAESMVAFVNTMLHGRSAALPGRRESAALGSRFLRERPANHARYLN